MAGRQFGLLKATKVDRDTPRILEVVLPAFLRLAKLWLVESLLRVWWLLEHERLERVRAIRIVHRSVVDLVKAITLLRLVKALDSAGHVGLNCALGPGGPTMELLLLKSLVYMIVDPGLLCRLFVLLELHLILPGFADLRSFERSERICIFGVHLLNQLGLKIFLDAELRV